MCPVYQTFLILEEQKEACYLPVYPLVSLYLLV
jgi:hypothetical protein